MHIISARHVHIISTRHVYIISTRMPLAKQNCTCWHKSSEYLFSPSSSFCRAEQQKLRFQAAFRYVFNLAVAERRALLD